jgi:hypothetical protein
MTSRQAIVITVSGLAPAVLGPYGSAILKTPSFDRIAASGCVVDRFIADSDEPSEVLRSMWNGRGTRAENSAPVSSALWQLISSGVNLCFFSDQASLVQLARESGFQESLLISSDRSEPEVAEDSEQTSTAMVFAAAAERLKWSPAPDLLWIHLDCLVSCWDVPLQERGHWAEDDEGPQPLKIAAPPVIHDPQLDPDVMLSWVYTYADQVRLIDTCLGEFLNQVQYGEETMVLVAGCSGMAMGEHGWLGPSAGPLLSPRTHLPLILRMPGMTNVRMSPLCQPPDIAETLGAFLLGDEWVTTGSTSLVKLIAPESWCEEHKDDFAVSIAKDAIAIQSYDWHWYREASGLEKLFRKPADRFDLNDVITRADEIAEHFRHAYAEMRKKSAAD